MGRSYNFESWSGAKTPAVGYVNLISKSPFAAASFWPMVLFHSCTICSFYFFFLNNDFFLLYITYTPNKLLIKMYWKYFS